MLFKGGSLRLKRQVTNFLSSASYDAGKPDNSPAHQTTEHKTRSLNLMIDWWSWWRFTNTRPAGGHFPPYSGEHWTLSAGKVHSVFCFFKSFFSQYKWTLNWCEVTIVMENSYNSCLFHCCSLTKKQTNKKTKKKPKTKTNSTSYSSSYKSFRLYSYLSYACGRMQPHFWIETKTLVHFFCFVFVQ